LQVLVAGSGCRLVALNWYLVFDILGFAPLGAVAGCCQFIHRPRANEASAEGQPSSEDGLPTAYCLFF